jgi:uncharacterized protein (TIGR00290 family)
MNIMRVFVSWSGGKDSRLALYRAMNRDLKIEFLFSMLSEDASTSRSHDLRREVIEAQAKAVGIPIVFGTSSWEAYEEEFKKVIGNLKSLGVQGGVFGDINLQEHRDWVERVCSNIGVKAIEPLWNEEYDVLLNEFIDAGFEAIIVSTKASLIGAEWIGRPFDWEFIRYLGTRGLDLCGEKGEYHTLVTYGPIFKERIRILEFGKTLKNDRWVLKKLHFIS